MLSTRLSEKVVLYHLKETVVTGESIASAYMLLDDCVFRWAAPITSGPHRDFLNVGYRLQQ